MNHIVRGAVLLSDFCRNVLRLAVFNSFGECSIRKQRAFVLSKPAQDYSLSQAHDRVMTGSKMKTVKPQALVVTAIIIILSLLFWGAWLFLGYVADDWSSPPADERSVPAARTY